MPKKIKANDFNKKINIVSKDIDENKKLNIDNNIDEKKKFNIDNNIDYKEEDEKDYKIHEQITSKGNEEEKSEDSKY